MNRKEKWAAPRDGFNIELEINHQMQKISDD
jgi:hypothetical protein